MSTQQTSVSTGAKQDAHPNASVIAGLREVADFLAQHPELPAADYVSASFGYGITTDARERLTQLAKALGDRAEERRYQDTVTIEGRFGEVRVHADAKVRALVDAPPEPTDYEPILRACTDEVPLR